MKRPFAVIGLTFLAALAVCFHFGSASLFAVISVAAMVLVVAAVVFKLIKRDNKLSVRVIAAGLAVLAAVLSFVLFENHRVSPVREKYAGQPIEVEGYISDEVTIRASMQSFVIKTERINGEKQRVKIYCHSTQALAFRSFDNVKVRLTPQAEHSGYLLSKGVYLTAFLERDTDLTATGTQHFTPYQWAVSLRQRMKTSFKDHLDDDAACLCSAVLLGDKKALPSSVRDAFTQTGTSYLIVVSGMHLAIASYFLRALLRKCRVDDRIAFVVMLLFVIVFMAVTGFYPSVVRAGIMLLLIYLAVVLFRDPDGVNALGVAALVLTVGNPYAVGDIGLLLSFSSTLGILLWSDPLTDHACRILRLQEPDRKTAHGLRAATGKTVRRFLRWFVSFVAVSMTATLWVMPVTIIFFDSVAPLTVLISLIAYPLTALILVLSLLFALTGLTGMVLTPIARLLNILCGWLIAYIRQCAGLPFCHVEAKQTFFIIWVVVSVLLVVIGYLIHARKPYIFSAAVVSMLILSVGGALTALYTDDAATMTVMRSGYGYTIEVRKGTNVSLLGCGGSPKGGKTLMKRLERVPRIDTVLLTNAESRHAAYYCDIADGWDITNTLMAEKPYRKSGWHIEDVHLFGDNTTFTAALNSRVRVKVLTVHDRVYQYVYSDDSAVLIVPARGRLRDVPAAFLQADTVLLEGNAEDTALLNSKRVITLSDNSAVADAELLSSGASLELRL